MTATLITTRRTFLSAAAGFALPQADAVRAQTDGAPSGGVGPLSTLLSGPGGATLIGHNQRGTVQSFIDAHRTVVRSLGDGPYNAVPGSADQTDLLQSAINQAPPNATVFVPPGVKFNSLRLDFSANFRVAIDHLTEDDLADIGFSDKASGERQSTIVSSSKSVADPTGGMVAEKRLEGPIHPAWVVGVRPDMAGVAAGLGAGQRLFPARAGFYIEDQRVDTFRIFYEGHEAHSIYSGVKLHTWRRSNELFGVGVRDWRRVPAANTLITASPSGAKGLVRSVELDRTIVDWVFGTFRVGDILRTEDQTAVSQVSRVLRSVIPMPWLAQDLQRGNWSFGLPGGYALDLVDVAGDVGVTPSYDYGQHQASTTARPGFVWRWDLPSRPMLGASARQVAGESDKRAWMHDAPTEGTARGMLGAVCAALAFTDRMAVPPSAINVARLAKLSMGRYRIDFTRSMAGTEYSVQISMHVLMSAASDTTHYTVGYRIVGAGAVEISVRLIDLARGTSAAADMPPGAQISVAILNGDI